MKHKELKKTQKIIISISVIMCLLAMIHYIILPFMVGTTMNHLYNQNLKTKSGFYRINHSKVYSLNLEKDKYTNLVNYRGIGTGHVQVYSQKKYSYAIKVGLSCVTRDYNGKKKVKFGSCKKTPYLFNTQSESQTFIVPRTGVYQIELWGAGGGNAYALGIRFDQGGSGAYVSGNIELKKGDVLYLQVGSRGGDGTIIEDTNRLSAFYYPSTGGTAGYNGGGRGFDDPQTDAGGGGGGATDVRLISGNWDDFNSLKSRIMVAGGGGGSSRYYVAKDSIYGRGAGGDAGTTSGLNATKLIESQLEDGYGATQTTGYKFGIGENGVFCQTSLNGAGGGAGGYFGSKTGACGLKKFEMPTGAGGGSSYVSGCKECNSIKESSTIEKMEFADQPTHYSDKKFTNIKMIAGNKKMPNPFGGTMTGNRNDGYAKITFIR